MSEKFQKSQGSVTKNWQWYSTPESVDKGIVSVCAVAETVAAVVLYWWLACTSDTHWGYLLISTCTVPLLLMRSGKSEEKGAEWFLTYLLLDNHSTPESNRQRILSVVLLATVITLACLPVMSDLLLSYYTDWPLLVRAFLVVVSIFIIVGVVLVAVVEMKPVSIKEAVVVTNIMVVVAGVVAGVAKGWTDGAVEGVIEGLVVGVMSMVVAWMVIKTIVLACEGVG